MRLGSAAALVATLFVVAVPAAHAVDPPSIRPTVSGTPGDNGWYVSNVTIDVAIAGGGPNTTSTCQARYVLTATTRVTCTVNDPDSGLGSTFDRTFSIDKVAPSVTGAGPSRSANANGWFNAPLSVSFSGADGTSGIASCQSASYSGPDSASASVSGTCRDVAGNVSAAGSYSFKYDATAPGVTPAPARAPDANGWYNHALSVAFSGSDATSGVASCTSASYGGPDNGSGALPGTCTDNAGNTGSASFPFKYDASPPKLADVSIAPANKGAVVRWKVPADAAVTITRLPQKKNPVGKVVYRGKGGSSFTDAKLTNGLRYRYTLVARDEAGNSTHAVVFATPLALATPLPGQKMKAPPLLSWAPVAKASYYNVQLFRGKQKVMSVWPRTTTFKLVRSWRYGGRDYKLSPGRYRWYVWPGFGPRAQSKYGAMVGGSFFVVVR
jgi:hypothetical protein